MSVIGIRVAPDRISYAIILGGEGEPPRATHLVIPTSLSAPFCLQYVRTNLLDIIEEVGATKAGLRLTEPYGKKKGGVSSGQIFRFNLEGVVQELLASSPIAALFAGPLKDVAGLLGETKADVDAYIAKKKAFPPVKDIWNDTNMHDREAILTAFAAYNL